jgi:hypothetical protein
MTSFFRYGSFNSKLLSPQPDSPATHLFHAPARADPHGFGQRAKKQEAVPRLAECRVNAGSLREVPIRYFGLLWTGISFWAGARRTMSRKAQVSAPTRLLRCHVALDSTAIGQSSYRRCSRTLATGFYFAPQTPTGACRQISQVWPAHTPLVMAWEMFARACKLGRWVGDTPGSERPFSEELSMLCRRPSPAWCRIRPPTPPGARRPSPHLPSLASLSRSCPSHPSHPSQQVQARAAAGGKAVVLANAGARKGLSIEGGFTLQHAHVARGVGGPPG